MEKFVQTIVDGRILKYISEEAEREAVDGIDLVQDWSKLGLF
jgi:hypothetical protein